MGITGERRWKVCDMALASGRMVVEDEALDINGKEWSFERERERLMGIKD